MEDRKRQLVNLIIELAPSLYINGSITPYKYSRKRILGLNYIKFLNKILKTNNINNIKYSIKVLSHIKNNQNLFPAGKIERSEAENTYNEYIDAQNLQKIEKKVEENEKTPLNQNTIVLDHKLVLFNNPTQDDHIERENQRLKKKSHDQRQTWIQNNYLNFFKPNYDDQLSVTIWGERSNGKYRLLYKNYFYNQTLTKKDKKKYFSFLFRKLFLDQEEYDSTVTIEDVITKYASPTPNFEQYKNFKIFVTKDNKIKKDKLPYLFDQKFQEKTTNYEHCILSPIIEFLQNKKDDEQAKSMLKKIIPYYNQNKNRGLSIDMIKELINTLKYIGIHILSPIRYYNDIITLKHENNRKPSFVFNFINSIKNHLEFKMIKDIKDIDQEILSKEEINNLAKKLILEKEGFTYSQDNYDNYLKIDIFDKIYIEQNHDFEQKLFKQFIEQFKGLEMDLKTQYELTQFVRAGCFTSSVPIKFNKFKDIQKNEYSCLDMKTAYLKFQSCKYYQGFPSVFSGFYRGNFTIDFIKENIGYYKIENISYDEGIKFDILKYVENLKLFKTDLIYPSCFLLFLNKIGYKFDITHGAYCNKKLENIDVSMIQNEKKYYTKIIGKLGYLSDEMNINIHGDVEFGSSLIHLFGMENINVHSKNYKISPHFDLETDELQGSLTVNIKKNHAVHYSHIYGFITAYTYIQILEKLFEIPYEDTYQIMLDGIFMNKNIIKKYEDKGLFEIKNDQKLSSYAGDTFLNKFGDFSDINFKKLELSTIEFKKQITILNGAGGTGKTTEAINNNKNLLVCYVAPGYKLCRKIKKEYPRVIYTTYNTLTSKSGEHSENYKRSFSGNPTPNIIILDEFHQTSGEDMLNFIKNKFPYSKIYVIIDVFHHPILNKDMPYQLSIESSKYEFTFNYQKYEHKNYEINYRFKDNKLKDFCQEIRKYIKDGKFTNGIEYIYKMLPMIKMDELSHIYDYKNDTIICSLREGNKNKDNDYVYQLTKLLDKENNKKYLVNKSDFKYSKGDIIYDEKPKSNSELRHAFTAHAIQGETLKKPQNIYIYEKEMTLIHLYVSISRAEYFDQIKIIHL